MDELKKIQLYKKAFANTSMAYSYYPFTRAMDKLFAKYLCDIQILPTKSPRRIESKRRLFELVDILDKYTTLEKTTVSSAIETRNYINFKTFNVPEKIQEEIRIEADKHFKKPDEKTK